MKEWEEGLFEKARLVPTELSEARVTKMVAGLPLLPPPSPPWWSVFSLNTLIIMSTATLLIIATSWFLGSRPTATGERVDFQIDTIAQLSHAEEVQTELVLTPIDQPKLPAPVREKEVAIIPLPVRNPVYLAADLATKLPEDFHRIPPPATTITVLDEPCSTPRNRLSDPQMRSLRRKLPRLLVELNVVTSIRQDVEIGFLGGRPGVNGRLQERVTERRLLALLASYGIQACDARMIRITDQYIAIGDILNNRFNGQMKGTADLEQLDTPRYQITDTRSSSINNQEVKSPPSEVTTYGPYPVIPSTNWPRIGKRQLAKEEVYIGSFDELEISGLAVVYLRAGNSEHAKVGVAGMPREDLILRKEGDKLIVTTRGQHSGENIYVELSTNQLKSVLVSGAGELFSLDPIRSNRLRITVAQVGAAQLEVMADDLEINMNGGDLSISGSARSRRINGGSGGNRGTLRDRMD